MCSSCSPVPSVALHSGRCVGYALRYVCAHSQVCYLCYDVCAPRIKVCVCVCAAVPSPWCVKNVH